jgi:hypothetical protein
MKTKRRHLLVALVILGTCAVALLPRVRPAAISAYRIIRGRKTVGQRVEQLGPAVRKRLGPAFERIGVSYPPENIILVGLKEEKRMEVWVCDPPKLLKTYPVLGASGTAGPKLREGDLQVPEGLYRIESLNPNSRFHLALRVNYPNRHDREKGRLDGRRDLGGDIMIHGSNCSVGCLAMGNRAAEDLFVLAAETGLENISVILSPVDFRRRALPEPMPPVPDWTPELYASIKRELGQLDRRTGFHHEEHEGHEATR